MLHVPRRGRRARLAGLAAGLVALLWLSLEDNHVWPVALLGLALSVLGVALALMGSLGGRGIRVRQVVPGAALAGALAGLGASVVTAGLMLFKNALHAHIFLDFPPGLVLAVLERAPFWMAAGGLAGLGLALVWWAAIYRNRRG